MGRGVSPASACTDEFALECRARRPLICLTFFLRFGGFRWQAPSTWALVRNWVLPASWRTTFLRHLPYPVKKPISGSDWDGSVSKEGDQKCSRVYKDALSSPLNVAFSKDEQGTPRLYMLFWSRMVHLSSSKNSGHICKRPSCSGLTSVPHNQTFGSRIWVPTCGFVTKLSGAQRRCRIRLQRQC